MGDVVNLRTARKRKAKAESQDQATENRARFGKTKSERKMTAAELALSKAKLDGHERDK